MVAIRLTHEEHERYQALCVSKGIRSFSEMVRSAVNIMLAGASSIPHDAIESRLSQLESRIEFLAAEVHKQTEPIPNPTNQEPVLGSNSAAMSTGRS
jgi:hypothetical protein